MIEQTTASDFGRFATLLNRFNALAVMQQEPNLFNVGKRGHYENPTTELLSFFLNVTNQHGLGDSFFRGFASALASKHIASDIGSLERVETEVPTASGKRIDLLLETDTTVVMIECKINHHQNNPFDDYTAFGEARIKARAETAISKTLVKLVLCPDGTVAPALASSGWHGLSYNTLAQKIEQTLATTMFDNPYNKWALFAREFLLHIKGFYVMSVINEDEINFLNDYLNDFIQLDKYIHQNLIPRIFDKITTDLNASHLQNFKCKVEKTEWFGYDPVIKLSNSYWTTGSDIVLWMNADKHDVSHKINLHIDQQSDALIEQFRLLIGEDLCNQANKVWYESNKRYWCISWSFQRFELTDVFAKLVQIMHSLNDLELNYR